MSAIVLESIKPPDIKYNVTILTLVPDVSNLDLQVVGSGVLVPR